MSYFKRIVSHTRLAKTTFTIVLSKINHYLLFTLNRALQHISLSGNNDKYES